jgi:NADPH-dependent 2,4-dienoyl-CoA reductase/sulfur reductase-like enzyme
MKSYKYLIVGGGMTADAAAHGIRERDPNGSIGILSDESSPPYDRPPLSKKLWTGKPFDSIWRKTAETNATIHLGTRAVSGDAQRKSIIDERGESYAFEKLLVATGGKPRKLANAPEGIIYFRTVDDYKRLRELADRKSEFAVIGGGFIGSEIACAVAMAGCKVTLVFPESGIGARIYPPSLSRFLETYLGDKGIRMMHGESVASVSKTGARLTVATPSGKSVSADAVVAGIGIEPEVGLAKPLGLEVANGIVVDAELRAKAPDIFAAGDVANFDSPALGVRRRVEQEANENMMGEVAGRNMAGAHEPYTHLPFFYSDLFDLGYEAVGELDAGLEIVEDWREQFQKGVVYYLRSGRVRGVLLWNTWGQLDAARALILSNEAHSAKSLAGRIRD